MSHAMRLIALTVVVCMLVNQSLVSCSDSSSSLSIAAVCPGPPDVCPFIYQPVCATFRRTFSNPCVLRATICELASQGFEYVEARNGDCCSRNCPPFFIPVLGCDGQTYRNICELQRTSCIQRRCIYRAGTIGPPL